MPTRYVRQFPASSNRPWTPDEVALLGTLPDRVLAERLGRTEQAVSNRRRLAGVPSRQVGPAWKPEEVALLGNATDAEVARRLGRSIRAVRTKRNKLLIPNAPKPGREPRPATTAAPVPARPSPLPPDPENWVTVGEACRRLKLTRRRILTLAHAGRLGAAIWVGHYLLPRGAVEAFRPKPRGGRRKREWDFGEE